MNNVYFVAYMVITTLLCLVVTPQLELIALKHNRSIKTVATVALIACLLWPVSLPLGLYWLIKDGG